MTTRYKLTIEYDGTDFAGWQRQENALAVQQVIEEAIQKFCGETPSLHVAGRTDAGVHAVGQVAHVDIEKNTDAKTVRDAVNFHIGRQPVAILSVEQVTQDFHARFGAKKRVYCYRLLMNRAADPAIGARYVWHVWKDLDIAAMQLAANHLLGLHDFSSFRDAECQAKSPLRTVDRLEFIENKNHLGDGTMIEFWAEAQSFLHHQIRNFMGTLKMVGEGKLSPDDVKKILEAKDRTKAGMTAPASGLHFVRVEY